MGRGLFDREPAVRVLLTGSRKWYNEVIMRDGLNSVINRFVARGRTDFVLTHGGALGADEMGAKVWRSIMKGREFQCRIVVMDADWDKYDDDAGTIRNKRMVSHGADICVAFPLNESLGTRNCMRLAEKAGIEVVNFGDHSDGSGQATRY